MKRKILLVEDNELNQDMLARFLAIYGFGVVLADDGQAAIEVAKLERPDLILMDMSLPELDGWEATRRLKQDEKTKTIPVIALTAHAMAGDRERAFQAGCDEYETKPVDFAALLKKIEAILKTEKVA